MANALTEREN